MDKLYEKSQRKIRQVPTEFKRYLFNNINPGNRINIIKGARGVGKTTLLLQLAKRKVSAEQRTLYVSLDDLFFVSNTLYELAEAFYKDNGMFLFLDEVHKYPGWSREIKLIYDDFPGLHLVVTSSSLLEIYKSEADLSRRAVTYELKELSFREFLYFNNRLELPAYDLSTILKNAENISSDISTRLKPLHAFKKYLQFGMYPYFTEYPDSFHEILLQTVNLTLEVDLPSVEHIDFIHIVKIKKLLSAIASSVPFTPNISKLSERTGISRNALVKALHYLDKSRLIILLNKKNKGISQLSKPDKIWLNNPNLHYALALDNINKGAIRESFFVNQIKGLYPVYIAAQGDFIVDNKYTFEVGGKNKTGFQIKNIPQSYIVADDLEIAVRTKIPLWLFGFLY